MRACFLTFLTYGQTESSEKVLPIFSFGYDGTHVSAQDARAAVEAYDAGRIKLHIPRDHSVGSSFGSVNTVTELLLRRHWMLAAAENNDFITTSRPVLLVWDELTRHLKHPVGFGLRETTVYFPISPKLMMIGKFEPVKESGVLDSAMVAMINGLHGIYSPQYLISKNPSATVRINSELIQFKDLAAAFQKLKSE